MEKTFQVKMTVVFSYNIERIRPFDSWRKWKRVHGKYDSSRKDMFGWIADQYFRNSLKKSIAIIGELGPVSSMDGYSGIDIESFKMQIKHAK